MGIDDTCEGEQQRLSALRGYCIAGPPEDPVFDRITDMASRLYRVPLACISLLDETRVWFKSHHGLNIQEIPRAGSPQEIAIQSPSVTIIPDLQRDTRFAPHPVVFGGIPLRFYASAPLTTPEGYRIGALCLADTRP